MLTLRGGFHRMDLVRKNEHRFSGRKEIFPFPHRHTHFSLRYRDPLKAVVHMRGKRKITAGFHLAVVRGERMLQFVKHGLPRALLTRLSPLHSEKTNSVYILYHI